MLNSLFIIYLFLGFIYVTYIYFYRSPKVYKLRNKLFSLEQEYNDRNFFIHLKNKKYFNMSYKILDKLPEINNMIFSFKKISMFSYLTDEEIGQLYSNEIKQYLSPCIEQAKIIKKYEKDLGFKLLGYAYITTGQFIFIFENQEIANEMYQQFQLESGIAEGFWFGLDYLEDFKSQYKQKMGTEFEDIYFI